MENETVVASGRIRKLEKSEITHNDIKMIEADITDQTELPLQTEDIYKDYRLRGYHYNGSFIGITGATYDGRYVYYIKFLGNIFKTTVANNSKISLKGPKGTQCVSFI